MLPTTSIQPAFTSGGSASLRAASTKIQIASATSTRAVDERGEDLGAGEAEAPSRRRRATREPGRAERETERARVGDHVHGIREQRQRVGDQPAGDLDDCEREHEHERRRERAPLGVARVPVCVRVRVQPTAPTPTARRGRS